MHGVLKYTQYEKGPTDAQLDDKIKRVRFILAHLWPEFKYIMWRKFKRFMRYGILKFLRNVVIISIVLGIIGFCAVKVYNTQIRVEYKSVVVNDTIYQPDSLKTMSKFIDAIGKHESGLTGYSTNTGNGMYGRYQFCESTLKSIGIVNDKVSIQTFLDTPELQDAAIKIYMRINKNTYYNDIAKYSGRKIAGILVTESGLLAACQLSPAGMQSWLHSNGAINFADKNGCSISSVVKEFCGYQIEL